jgi:hypothetical protein
MNKSITIRMQLAKFKRERDELIKKIAHADTMIEILQPALDNAIKNELGSENGTN